MQVCQVPSTVKAAVTAVTFTARCAPSTVSHVTGTQHTHLHRLSVCLSVLRLYPLCNVLALHVRLSRFLWSLACLSVCLSVCLMYVCLLGGLHAWLLLHH